MDTITTFVTCEELAALLGKEQKEVLRATRDMLFVISAFDLYTGVEHHYKYMYDYNGNVTEILLSRGLSLILISEYDTSLRRVINEHFDKLENCKTEENNKFLYVVDFGELCKIGFSEYLNEKFKITLERESNRKAVIIAAYTCSNLEYMEKLIFKTFEKELIIGGYFSTQFNNIITLIQKYSV